MSSYTILSYQGLHLPDEYRNLLFSKWMRSLRYGNDFFKLIESDAFYKAYNKVIVQILSNPATVVKLSVLTDDHDVVLGFSVSRGDILDYVYVHRDYRRTGIGGSLVPEPINTITHLTNTGMSIWNSKLPHAKFNPFT